MSLLRPNNERHDANMPLDTNPRRPLGVVGRKPFTIALLLASALGRASASPVHNDISPRNLGNSSSAPPSSFNMAIWIPVIVVVVFLIGFIILSWKGGVFSKLSACLSRRRRAGPATLGGARELTAEQLVGAINNNGATTVVGNAGRTRRSRRPRRTPSQISTTSLPAYNKEPGEEELVIFRGRDAEDVTMPAAVVMSAVDEDGEGDSLNSGDHSQVSRYSPMPTTPNNMPLLQGDESGDLSLQSLNSGTAANTDAQENSSLPDPRGEAPPYFEVVDQPEGPRREVTMMTESPVALEAPPLSSPSSPEQRPQRHSTFRNFLNRMSVASTSHHSHTRVGSDNSITSSSFSHGTREGGTSRASHRPTPSGSSSHLTSSMFRTLSRQRSTNTLASNRLNSPSTISLNSISAPLTHTLSRTEFTYPKAGPTPEQLKVISSRDSFARFAVPYGPDAIAFASSSRQDLSYPPPDFDSAASDTQLPRSAGPSRLRASSNAAELLQHQEEEADSPEEEQGQGESLAQESSASSTSSPAATLLAPADSSVPQSAPSSSSLLEPQPITKSDSISKASIKSTLSPLSIPLPPTIKGTSTSTASSSSFATVSEFGQLTTSTAPVRSESRASNYSYQSYATAAESMGASTPRRNAAAGGASEPTTPKHEMEASDSTVVMTPVVIRSGSVRSTR